MKKSRKIILCIFLLLLSTAITLLTKYYLDFKEREKKYDSLILATAKRHNVSPALVKAVICRESKFQASIRGQHGEYGLMQITPAAADDWIRVNRKKKFTGYEQLFIPELNIEIGTWYLAVALKKWRDYKEQYSLALAQYNAGPGTVIKKKWVPSHKDGDVLTLITFPSTKAYIRDILEYNRQYQQKGFGK